MAAEGPCDAHGHVAWVGERRIHGEIADHTRDQAVIGVASAKHAFEQSHAEGFDFINVLSAGEPAIHLANVPFGGPYADFGREQRAYRRARAGFRSEQVEALFPTPVLVALDGADHGIFSPFRTHRR
jgi:hypothetical protein